MKKCLKRLLQCSIVLLLLNCQSEDLAIDSHEHSKLKIQRISLEELKSKPKALDALKKIREKSKTDAQAKLTYNSANDFYVDTEEIVYIEKEETHSYTFAVYRKQSTAYFENLVMTQQEDGSYSSTLVSYTLTEQERQDLNNEQLYSLDGKMSAISLDSGTANNELLMNRMSCITVEIPTCSYGEGGVHFAGPGCTKVDGSYSITACSDTSEPHAPISYISGPGGSGTGSSGGGGGGSIPNTQTPITSQPTNPTPQPNPSNPIAQIDDITVPLIKPSPKERFISSNEDWLDDNPNEGTKIINFLDENGYTEENKELVQKIIIYHQNNPQPDYTQNNYPGQNDDLPYQWWQDDEFMEENLTIFEQVPNGVELLLFSIFPDKALSHKNNSNTALDKARELFLNGTLTGITDGRADAFRHAYWNALDTAEIGSALTEVFTDAHEAFSSGLSKQMDLYNNEKGREKAIAMHFNFFTSDSEIASSILIEVYIGHLVYILNGILTYTN